MHRQAGGELAAGRDRDLRHADQGWHGGAPPATISVLSGDVHHTYVSEADYLDPLESRVYQITCSPINNTIPLPMRVVFRFSWSKVVERVVRFLDRWTHVPPLPIQWHHPSGPHFGNMLALLTLDGHSARVRLERSIRVDEDAAHEHRIGEDLAITAELSLTDLPRRST